MYLSQLILDPACRDVMDDLANPYQLHRRVMSGFAPDLDKQSERVLYRLEMKRTPPHLVVLVQSRTLPKWDGLLTGQYLLDEPLSKWLELAPRQDQVFRFRLTANPTKRLKGDGKKDGSRVGLLREEEQTAWLKRKGQLNGFLPLEVEITRQTQPPGWKEENGRRHRLTFQVVRFDGLLQVVDPGLFHAALLNGIGSGKGFGLGMLSLIPTET